MAKVAIVTDTTATIPQDVIDEYDIQLVPQVLIWGEETLEDGIDIQPSEFYERLVNDKIHPTTSQVTPASFIRVFDRLLDRGDEILAILISKKLSGSIESAIQAKALHPGAPIEIVDSESVAMGLGFQVLTAARAAREGATLEECKALAIESIPHTGVVFALDTLEFLHRGGRIGGGTRFLGTALNLKPIMEIRDGRVEPIDRVRTRKKSLNRVLNLVAEQIAGRSPVRIASLHAAAEEEARILLDEAVARFDPVETYFTEVSPVVGTHAGPGTLGIAYMAGM
jgi:DegV family protein with EDD domain